MSSNSFGRLFRVHSFGESHGAALGVVIDGCPSGVEIDLDLLKSNLSRRRPASSKLYSSRGEPDEFELLSGVHEGLSLGTPIAAIVRNKDARSSSYQKILGGSFRRGHADEQWSEKFVNADLRGGGRSSGRETLARVIAGSFAQMFLKGSCPELRCSSFVAQLGPFELSEEEVRLARRMGVGDVDSYAARFPSRSLESDIEDLLLAAKEEGRSYGGTAELWASGMPAGLGEPVFEKLKSKLASAFMSVGATIGVEFGQGFKAARAEGSEFHGSSENLERYGGMRGGISDGEPLGLRVAFKPTSSVLEVAKMGRHDPCIVPRALPVLEAMFHLVVADLVLMKRLNNI